MDLVWLFSHDDFLGFLGPFALLSLSCVSTLASRVFLKPLEEVSGRQQWSLKQWPNVPDLPDLNHVYITILHFDDWRSALTRHTDDYSLLGKVVRQGNDDAASLLLSIAKRASVAQELVSHQNPLDGRQPIHLCRTRRSVRMLVACNADVHSPDKLRRLPIEWATRLNYTEAVDELLKHMTKKEGEQIACDSGCCIL
eukprot:GEMP01054345.1.p1 GENE.GEMP01054345.1~~GEMP01054345.1.p1  ORF type:complete len:197 (+),score=43.27 GEMP01054345.1:111-701(+)